MHARVGTGVAWTGRGRATPFLLVGLLALTAASVAVGGSARAATVRALSLDELTAAAELIVVGQARERQSRWSDSGRLIVSDVAVGVERVVKGRATAGQDLVVTHLGGSIGDLGLRVPGAAAFELGGRAVLFLRAHPATGELRVVGMSQGALPVVLREGGQVVLPGAHGAALMAADVDGALRPAPAALGAPVALEAFIGRVVAAMRASR